MSLFTRFWIMLVHVPKRSVFRMFSILRMSLADGRGRAKGRGCSKVCVCIPIGMTFVGERKAETVVKCVPPLISLLHFFFHFFFFPPADVRGRAEGRSDTRRQLAVAPRLGAWAWAGVHIFFYFFFIVVCITAFSLCVFERERESE